MSGWFSSSTTPSTSVTAPTSFVPTRPQQPPPVKTVTSTRGTNATASFESQVAPWLVAGASLAIAYKLYKLCVLPTSADQLTVVYDKRRRSLFSSSHADTLGIHPRPRANLLQRLLRVALRPGPRHVVVPPGGLHGAFSMPLSVLDPQVGATAECVVEDLHVSDATLRCVMEVGFFVDVREIERYLSVVGPTAPLAHIGAAVSQCLLEEAASSSTPNNGPLTAALLLHKPNISDGSPFMENLRARVQSRLVADCCVVLKFLRIHSVQLASTL